MRSIKVHMLIALLVALILPGLYAERVTRANSRLAFFSTENQSLEDFFEARVRPLFVKRCFACHANAGMGGLRLDSRESLLKGGASGPAIVPGEPERSLLIQAINRTHPRLKMPPDGMLNREEIADLTKWVGTGAFWPAEVRPSSASSSPAAKSASYVISAGQRAFWSFQPIRKPPLPRVKNKTWVQWPVDHFILAKLEEQEMQPAPPAQKRALLRRATFDLIGLPPANYRDGER